MSQPRPYRLFRIRLERRIALSPHMARLTFGGEDVRRMKTGAPDQRVKLFFPDPAGRPPALEDAPDWYARYKVQPISERPPMRTYTIRALRPDLGELDIDFVLHGETGPASRWALNAAPGDEIQIMAPAADHAGDSGGYEWKPPSDARDILLLADETALPALAGILEELAERRPRPRVQAFVEIPHAADRLDDLPQWPGLALAWLARQDGATHGSRLIAAAAEAALPADVQHPGAAVELAEIDIDAQLPWERADQARHGGFYGWVAGESAAVMAIRKLLVQTRGVPREQLNLMGYWRLGRAME